MLSLGHKCYNDKKSNNWTVFRANVWGSRHAFSSFLLRLTAVAFHTISHIKEGWKWDSIFWNNGPESSSLPIPTWILLFQGKSWKEFLVLLFSGLASPLKVKHERKEKTERLQRRKKGLWAYQRCLLQSASILLTLAYMLLVLFTVHPHSNAYIVLLKLIDDLTWNQQPIQIKNKIFVWTIWRSFFIRSRL